VVTGDDAEHDRTVEVDQCSADLGPVLELQQDLLIARLARPVPAGRGPQGRARAEDRGR
jgi:hypothetical protein